MGLKLNGVRELHVEYSTERQAELVVHLLETRLGLADSHGHGKFIKTYATQKAVRIVSRPDLKSWYLEHNVSSQKQELRVTFEEFLILVARKEV